MWENREFFTGVSFLSETGDYDYQQPPFQEVYHPSEIEEDDEHREEKLRIWERFCELSENMKSVSYADMYEETDTTEVQGELACTGGSCELPYQMERS